jgi:hypothetical protein
MVRKGAGAPLAIAEPTGREGLHPDRLMAVRAELLRCAGPGMGVGRVHVCNYPSRGRTDCAETASGRGRPASDHTREIAFAAAGVEADVFTFG